VSQTHPRGSLRASRPPSRSLEFVILYMLLVEVVLLALPRSVSAWRGFRAQRAGEGKWVYIFKWRNAKKSIPE
jgi:hypothetical protein